MAPSSLPGQGANEGDNMRGKTLKESERLQKQCILLTRLLAKRLPEREATERITMLWECYPRKIKRAKEAEELNRRLIPYLWPVCDDKMEMEKLEFVKRMGEQL